MDKAIEIMKAAMEKEKAMKDKQDANAKQHIDEDTPDLEAAEYIMTDEEQGMDADTQEDLNMENMEASEEKDLSEGQDVSEEADEKPEKTGKGFFKNMKSKELAAKDQKIAELNDRLLRTMAEFDNFRKRTEKEKSTMYDMGVKSIIERILPVVDSFERGLGTITEEEKQGAFAQGIELIYRQLTTSLDEIGLKPIDAVGKDFDPNLHNAVMHGEDENLGENIVSDEFQKGYIYRDMVVRHSMVKVVN
jgi:molecular chaperone GrpE